LQLQLKPRYIPIFVVLLVGAICVYLFLFSMSSSAYKAAIPVLFSSKEVQAFLGEAPERSLLVGVSQLLSTRSCAEITFYVSGRERSGFVQLLLMQEQGNPWKVYEVVPGWFSDSTRSCRFNSGP
jgi:hypothetical protein